MARMEDEEWLRCDSAGFSRDLKVRKTLSLRFAHLRTGQAGMFGPLGETFAW